MSNPLNGPYVPETKAKVEYEMVWGQHLDVCDTLMI